MPELIALYHRIADAGALIGHPVAVGNRAALRLAIGAEDVLRGDIVESLTLLETAFLGLGFRTEHLRRKKKELPRDPLTAESDGGLLN
jgi:hypothetical protein